MRVINDPKMRVKKGVIDLPRPDMTGSRHLPEGLVVREQVQPWLETG